MSLWSRLYLRACPDCGVTVVWPDNNTLLDWPNEAYEAGVADWTIEKVVNFPGFRKKTKYLAMKNRPPVFAATQDSGRIRVAHRLHEHQPPESIVRRGKLPWEVAIREDRHAS